LAISGRLLYHVPQKSVPKAVHPFVAVIIANATGIALCAVGMLLDPAGRSFQSSLKNAKWAVIGVGAMAIEVGFLLAYRAGWNINSASVVRSISVALLLIPIGLLAFKEHLSARSAAGVCCCLPGLYLLSKK
jgi:drug/metabolite transporter (DMT)-like permease